MKDIQLHTLGYYVDRTFTNMVKFLNQELKKANLDFQHPQFSILMVLSKNDGISQSLLTDFVDRDKASVSRNLNSLEKKGYIIRRAYGEKRKKIFLSEKAKEILPIIYEISRKDTETTLKGFSESKKKSVYDILTKMYGNIYSAIEK